MKNEKIQTLLEWFLEQLDINKITMYNERGESTKVFTLPNEDLIRIAKEKEKEQKRRDFIDGYMHGEKPLNHGVIDKWYYKTYGGENESE